MRFMQTSKLFTLLPEELVCTPDGMAIDRDGNLILSCPNFADLSMPSCVLKIDKDRNIKKWFDVPRNEYTGEARAMGIEFGPDGDLYLVDNAGWTGEPHMVFTGRILRLRLNDAGVVKCTVVADNMEHPNGIRIWGDYMYVTQSCMTRQKTDSGKLMSCVYRFPLDAEGIHCTNTLADPHIFLTFITENPKCQYGVDGIVFDHDGNLYVGNFGDGVVHKITFNPDGSVKENRKWACDPANLKSTDGMTIDPYGNIYVADFSANAIARITPDGRVTRMACSPDTDGFHGELDEPGEPCVWGDKIIVSCFDLVTDEEKDNLAGLLLDDVVQALAVVLQRQLVGDQLLDLHRAALQILQRPAKAVGLGEGAEDGVLLAENVVGADGYLGVGGADAVGHNLAAHVDKVEAGLEHRGGPSGVDDNVEALGHDGLDLGGVLGRVGLVHDHQVGKAVLAQNVQLVGVGIGDDHAARPCPAEQLGQADAGGACAEHEDGVAEAGGDAVHAVDCAGGGLGKGGLLEGQLVAEGEHLVVVDEHILGKAAGHVAAVGVEVLAVQGLVAAARLAVAAQLGVVGGDPVAHLPLGDGAAHCVNDAGELVAVHQGELGQKASVVDGQVGLADAAGLDPDDHLMGAGLRLGQIYHGKLPGGGVLNGFHACASFPSGRGPLTGPCGACPGCWPS